MTRRIDEIKHIVLTVERIVHLNRMGLDCDPTLTLQIHIIEKLILLFAFSNRTSCIEQTVSQGAFTMIDMGNDAKIPNVFHQRVKRTTKILNCTL